MFTFIVNGNICQNSLKKSTFVFFLVFFFLNKFILRLQIPKGQRWKWECKFYLFSGFFLSFLKYKIWSDGSGLELELAFALKLIISFKFFFFLVIWCCRFFCNFFVSKTDFLLMLFTTIFSPIPNLTRCSFSICLCVFSHLSIYKLIKIEF